MACLECADEVNGLRDDIAERDDRIKELEKALDDVQGEINAAKGNLDDASRIVGRMI